jgi:hypothetical protein
MTFEIVKYSPDKAKEWDGFVKQAWNGVFLFYRGFMDYHAHLFNDHSLMVYADNSLKAVLPANERDGIFYSHLGLTYGGWVLAPRFPADELDQLMVECEAYLTALGIHQLQYKHKPQLFAKQGNDYDGWVLWKNGYELWRRDLSFYIDMQNSVGFARDKRYRLNKSRRNNLTLKVNADLPLFMDLVKENLNRKYQTNPVHSTEEAMLLQSRFPNNIFTYTVWHGDDFLGGAWLFVDNDFVHTQYLHFNNAGRDLCAVEFLVDALMEQFSPSKRWFSFGTSTENNGRELNSGLASFKEGFGAAGVCHDFYKKELCK